MSIGGRTKRMLRHRMVEKKGKKKKRRNQKAEYRRQTTLLEVSQNVPPKTGNGSRNMPETVGVPRKGRMKTDPTCKKQKENQKKKWFYLPRGQERGRKTHIRTATLPSANRATLYKYRGGAWEPAEGKGRTCSAQNKDKGHTQDNKQG